MDTSKLERGVRYNTNTGQVLAPRGTNVPAPIDISTINTPIQPLAVKQPELSSASTGVLASADALTTQAENFANTLVEKTKLEQDKTENQGILKSLYSKITNSKGKTELTDKTYNTDLGAGTSVNAAQKELNDINAQYRSVQRAQKAEIDAIGKGGPVNPQQFNAANAAINRQYASQLADLAVIQQSKMDNYSAAKEIADRKVTIELEKESQDLDALKYYYEQNRDQLNTKEERQFNALIAERTRLLTEQATEKTNINNLVIEAAKSRAPNSVLQQAIKSSTVIEALGLLSQYLPQDQFQLTTDAYGNPTVFNPRTGKIGATTEDSSKIIEGNDGKTYDLSTYATDPKHGENIKRIMGQIGPIISADQLVEAIKTFAPNSPVTANMISNAASKAGVDVTLLTSLLIAESSLGTKGAGAKTFNPGNVGNVDSGATRNYGNWQAGVDAAAQQLARRATDGTAPKAVAGDITTVPLKIRPEVTKIRDQFDGEAIVKKFNVIQEANALVKTLDSTSTDDQALIYAFAKAMDPDSVVREGEYATVQKYAQSWAEQFGFKAARIASNTPFLSAEARENIKNTIGKKYGAVESQYDNLYTDYGRRIDAITKRSDGTAFITNYKKAFQNSDTNKPPSANDPLGIL